MSRLLPTWLVLVALTLGLGLAALPAQAAEGHGHEDSVEGSFSEYVPGASRLEGRLLSPCCWETNGGQTLDVHRSPAAEQLRREIRKRLKAGESPEAIEASLVKRYTARILAVPTDSPMRRVGPLLATGLAGGLGIAVWLITRWRRRSAPLVSKAATAAATPEAGPDAWDARLDEELDEAE
jgi:cytochrome c-type biogenesis protein CcmH